MRSAGDDVSWYEFRERVRIIVTLVFLLVFAEYAFRWLTDPSDSLAPLQVAIAWLWNLLHSLIFGADTVTLTNSTGGLPTVLDFSHPSFVGSSMLPLEVTDECVGVHEIAFVSFLILLTPGISAAEKKKGVLVMAAILATLNIVRLLLLYPLAVSGCESNPGVYGCWAPMWEFHQFMLEYGFMLIILLGWTGWFLAVGGPSKTRSVRVEGMLPAPLSFTFRRELTPKTYAVLAVCVLLAAWGANTLAIDEDAKKERLEAEGCEGVVTSYCAAQVDEWGDISGKAWRALLLSVIGASATVVNCCGVASDEEE